jgi:predicted ATPase/DNA-binding SARP family transcriptional activator/Tfp pilus assembly protein PilF
MHLSIALLGPFQVRLGEQLISHFESVKVRALLAYLAAEAGHPHDRSVLSGLLWPDWPGEAAQKNLRHSLYSLRKLLGDQDAAQPYLLIDHQTIQLNREADVGVDVKEFEAVINEQRSTVNFTDGIGDIRSTISNLQSAISLYRGPFLDGFDLGDSPAFEEWLLARREHYNQQMLQALSRLADVYLEQGQPEQAESFAYRQIDLEPWSEKAHQQLMRALSLKGARVQALAQYESLKKALQRELKVEPSKETLQLYQQIRDGGLGVQKEAGIEVGTLAEKPPEAVKPLHNLPAQLTSFIGREKEIDAVKGLLQGARLVTLTGPGGTGKTRLALQTAAGLLDQFADGVWLAELAPLVDPALVPAIVARALGLRELAGLQIIILLQEYLEHRQVLLILDNCEHVIEACARLAETLLQACPKLTLLASSREALGIPGEVCFRVPPLTLPDAHQMPPFEVLGQYEAIRLFIERAAMASLGFTLTPDNAPAILQVCQRLDGIPLAIELAAARVKLLQVAEIAQHLDDRFRLLTGGSRAALPRYQTLRASIDWSYELLSPSERSLLQRLSVFTGGWVLEGAEAVGCGDDLASCDVLELLGQLVDKSLVNPGFGSGSETRYRMLETIRQYAHEKLVEAGQAEAVRYRHLQYYLELAEKLGEKIRGPDQAHILERLEAELDNLRLALAWSLDGRGRPGWDPEPGLRLAAALWWFWHCRGRQDEGIHWLELLLAGEMEERADRPLTPERTRCRARALYVAAWSTELIMEITKSRKFSEESCELYRSLGANGRVGYAYGTLFKIDRRAFPIESIRLMDECQAIFQEAGDRSGLAECFMVRGDIAAIHKEYQKATVLWEELLALRKEIGDLDGAAGSLFFLGSLACLQGKLEHGRALFDESLALFIELRNNSIQGTLYINLGEIDLLEGNYARAATNVREALSIGHRQGDVPLIQDGLLSLGMLALLQGNTQEAAERFEESLTYFRKKDHKAFIADSLYYLGLFAWTTGEFEQARRIYTEALDNYREELDNYREELPDYRASPNIFHEAGMLCELGKVALARGEIILAEEQFAKALEINPLIHHSNWENREPAMLTLEATATLAAAQGLLERATCLLGATEAWHTRFYHSRTPRERQEREACIAAVRATLAEQAFAAAWSEGIAMTQEQAMEYAQKMV